MAATLVHRVRRNLRDGVFFEIVVWRVPTALRGSSHPFKYRMALVAEGVCVMWYDNEAGKGDHRRVGDEEFSYRFEGIDKLLADFAEDVKEWLDGNP